MISVVSAVSAVTWFIGGIETGSGADIETASGATREPNRSSCLHRGTKAPSDRQNVSHPRLTFSRPAGFADAWLGESGQVCVKTPTPVARFLANTKWFEKAPDPPLLGIRALILGVRARSVAIDPRTVNVCVSKRLLVVAIVRAGDRFSAYITRHP